MEMSLSNLKDKLNSIDIDFFGVLDPVHYIQPRYYDSMMEYYSKEQIESTYRLEKFKSAIVIALNYKPSKYPILMSTGSCEKDYHRVFKEKVIDLSKIYDLGLYEAYTDTGPLFDRSLGLLSGLGFIGKNQCLINPQYGSFFYVGYILTDKLIERTNTVYENQCGSCNRCISACPTKALSKNGYNPEICLAHLTQTKHPDPKFIKYIKTFYGCDVCQKVCPYNEGTKIGMKEFNCGIEMTYEDLFLISNKEYAKKYSECTFYWKKRAIIKRNAILRAKNIKDESISPFIELELRKKNPNILEYL